MHDFLQPRTGCCVYIGARAGAPVSGVDHCEINRSAMAFAIGFAMAGASECWRVCEDHLPLELMFAEAHEREHMDRQLARLHLLHCIFINVTE